MASGRLRPMRSTAPAGASSGSGTAAASQTRDTEHEKAGVLDHGAELPALSRVGVTGPLF